MQQHFLSEGEVLALLSATPAKGGTVTLAGKPVAWRPVTVAEYLRHVARFKSVRAFFTFGASIGLAKAAIEAGQDVPVEPDADGYLDAQVDDGPLADAAFVAIAIGHGGSAAVEQALLSVPDEEFAKALATIEEGTWGDDPGRFFGAVGKGMNGRLMTVMQTAAQRKAGTASSPKAATTSSTRTASKAKTAPRRKPRRK